MKNKPLEIDIISFFESAAILNIKTLSPTQKVILKVIFGESLDRTTPIPNTHNYQEKDHPGGFKNEVELFKWLTGKDEYVEGRRYTDCSAALGRRSGKSNLIAAGIALYKATQEDYSGYLGSSPFATIPIISPTKEQANEVYHSIRNFLLRSPYLFNTFLDGKLDGFKDEYLEDDIGSKNRLTGKQIRLNNKVVVKILTADISVVRGFACPFYILDEAAWMGVDGNDTKNTDKGINEALQPSTAQFGDKAFGLKISSPNGQSGLMFEDYENRKEPYTLHFQAPTWWANPNIPEDYLEKQKLKGITYFLREYGASYISSETAYLDSNLVDSSIIKGIEKIDPLPNFRYVAAMDYATKGDYWAFSIGHKEYVLDEDKKKKEKVQIDFIIGWKGKAGEELNPDHVLDEIAIYMKKYRVAFCLTDQYAFAALKSLAMRKGILLKEFKISHQSKLKYMYSLQIAINSGIFSMVHHPTAVKHLKDLREKRSNISNKLKIEAVAGGHDDFADSTALVVYQFDKTSPVYIGHHYEEKVKVIENKDASGKFIKTPTATELADKVGVLNFYDNSEEHDAKDDPNTDDDDDGNFWFSI